MDFTQELIPILFNFFVVFLSLKKSLNYVMLVNDLSDSVSWGLFRKLLLKELYKTNGGGGGGGDGICIVLAFPLL